MNLRYPSVAARALHRCEYFKAPEVCFNSRFEVEHVLPSSEGGATDDTNLALSCRPCNLFKSDQTTGVDPRTGEKVRLFNPRRDRWHEHFQVSPDFMITGRTGVGRATIAVLRLNAEEQVAARQRWARLKLYPPT